ncbi:MAG: DUF2379 family protein [Pseudomonadota bacterium]
MESLGGSLEDGRRRLLLLLGRLRESAGELGQLGQLRQLDEIAKATERGDYAAARQSLRELLAASPTPAVRQAAQDALARLAPDRATIALAVDCGVFFLLVVYIYLVK